MVTLKLAGIAIALAVIATASAPAAAKPVVAGKIEFDAKNHTLEHLAEEGIAFSLIEPAEFGVYYAKFPVFGGKVGHAGKRGIVRGRGGFLFSRDDPVSEYDRAVAFKNPRFVIAKHKIKLFMDVNGARLLVAALRNDHNQHVSGGHNVLRLQHYRADFSEPAAAVVAETFDLPYPGPGTALGFFRFKAELGRR